MNIDPTITFGAIMNAVVLLIGFVVAFTKIGGRIDMLALRLAAVETSLQAWRDTNERLAIIETRQATHGQMIAAGQTKIDELAHGEGFVRGKLNRGVDGEY